MLLKRLRTNAVEIWATLSLFVGLPVVISLYLDYRAGLAFFFISSVVVGIIVLRRD